MSEAVFTSKQLEAAGLVVVHKKDLKDLLLEVQVESRVDNRVKWLTKPEVKRIFGVNDWRMRTWRDKIAAGDPTCLVRIRKEGGKTSKILWNKESIEAEMEKIL